MSKVETVLIPTTNNVSLLWEAFEKQTSASRNVGCRSPKRVKPGRRSVRTPSEIRRVSGIPAAIIDDIRRLLAVGDIQSARRIAEEGLANFPFDSSILNLSQVLSVPKLINSQLPADPNIGGSHDWLKSNAKHHRGQWVALRGAELLGSAATFQELIRQVQADPSVLITKIT